jgi:hypothetical protein
MSEIVKRQQAWNIATADLDIRHDVRAGDTDRSRHADHIHQAAMNGYLDPAEAERRVTAAMQADCL